MKKYSKWKVFGLAMLCAIPLNKDCSFEKVSDVTIEDSIDEEQMIKKYINALRNYCYVDIEMTPLGCSLSFFLNDKNEKPKVLEIDEEMFLELFEGYWYLFKDMQIQMHSSCDHLNKSLKFLGKIAQFPLKHFYYTDSHLQFIISDKEKKLYLKTTLENINYQYIPKEFEVYFENPSVYHLAIYLTQEDFIYFNKNHITLNLDSKTVNEIRWINTKMDEMLSQIDIDDTTSEFEKFNKVLYYITEKYSYDYECLNKNLRETFYKEGFLWGAFHNDKIICGNYAALFSALLKRVGINAFILYSPEHAWNLVELNSEYYYVDPTFLDDVSDTFVHDFKDEVSFSLALLKYRYYLIDPTENYLYQPTFFPEEIQVQEIKDLKFVLLSAIREALMKDNVFFLLAVLGGLDLVIFRKLFLEVIKEQNLVRVRKRQDMD